MPGFLDQLTIIGFDSDLTLCAPPNNLSYVPLDVKNHFEDELAQLKVPYDAQGRAPRFEDNGVLYACAEGGPGDPSLSYFAHVDIQELLFALLQEEGKTVANRSDRIRFRDGDPAASMKRIQYAKYNAVYGVERTFLTEQESEAFAAGLAPNRGGRSKSDMVPDGSFLFDDNELCLNGIPDERKMKVEGPGWVFDAMLVLWRGNELSLLQLLKKIHDEGSHQAAIRKTLDKLMELDPVIIFDALNNFVNEGEDKAKDLVAWVCLVANNTAGLQCVTRKAFTNGGNFHDLIVLNNEKNNPGQATLFFRAAGRRCRSVWRGVSYPFRYSQHKGFWSHLGWGLVATGLVLATILAAGLAIGAAVVSHGASIPFTVAAKGIFVSAGKWVGMHLAPKVATAEMFTSANAVANAGAFVAGAAAATVVTAATLGAAVTTPGDRQRAASSSGDKSARPTKVRFAERAEDHSTTVVGVALDQFTAKVTLADKREFYREVEMKSDIENDDADFFNQAVVKVINSTEVTQERFSNLMFLLVVYCERRAEQPDYGFLPTFFQALCTSRQKDIFKQNVRMKFDSKLVDKNLVEASGGVVAVNQKVTDFFEPRQGFDTVMQADTQPERRRRAAHLK